MSTYAITAAAAAGVPSLHALIESAYRGDSARVGWTHEADLLGGQRTDEAALRAIIADRDQRILLARDGTSLAGCVQVARAADARAHLGLLAVDSARQASGLGRALIAAAERLAATAFGAEVMEMTVIVQRAELIAYYARRGYVPTGETRPFPMHDPRFGLPRQSDLAFMVLAKPLAG